MANSSLQGYSWDIPEELHSHLRRTLNAYKGDKNVEGYKRLEGLVGEPKVSYEQLKRIKNFFDSHKTSNTDYMNDRKQDTQFILNGGRKMRDWCENTLNKARQGVEAPKKAKHSIGMNNQYQKDSVRHTKGIATSSVKPHSTSDIKIKKESYDDIYISKEVKLMESLINIFDKNKELCQHKQSLQS
jgi:hypothetical protein